MTATLSINPVTSAMEIWRQGFLQLIRDPQLRDSKRLLKTDPVLPSTHYHDQKEFWSWVSRFRNWAKTADCPHLDCVQIDCNDTISLMVRSSAIEDTSHVSITVLRSTWDTFWKQEGVESLTTSDHIQLMINVLRLTELADRAEDLDLADRLTQTAQLLWDTFQIPHDLCEYAMVYLACASTGTSLFRVVCHSLPGEVVLSEMRPEWCEIMMRCKLNATQLDRRRWLYEHTPAQTDPDQIDRSSFWRVALFSCWC